MATPKSPAAETATAVSGAVPEATQTPGATGQRAAVAAAPTADQVRRAFESGRYPYSRKMGRRAYEADKAALQAELLKVQLWAQEVGERFVLLFEGRHL